MGKENTKTEIVNSETVFLGREHVRFLEDVIDNLRKQSNYKITKSQIMRSLIEGAMRRNLYFDGISNEDELRRMLNIADNTEPTRIRKK